MLRAGRPSAKKKAITLKSLSSGLIRLNADVPIDLKKKAKIKAVREGLSLSQYITKALTEYFEMMKEEKWNSTKEEKWNSTEAEKHSGVAD